MNVTSMLTGAVCAGVVVTSMVSVYVPAASPTLGCTVNVALPLATIGEEVQTISKSELALVLAAAKPVRSTLPSLVTVTVCSAGGVA